MVLLTKKSVKMANNINKELMKLGKCQILVSDIKRTSFKDES